MILEFIPRKLNKNTKKIVKIIGSYGIIQVLAQDLGIKTGKKQRDLMHKIPVQFALLFSGSYLATSDTHVSLISVLIYFGLKYIYSKGETSKVCFESV